MKHLNLTQTYKGTSCAVSLDPPCFLTRAKKWARRTRARKEVWEKTAQLVSPKKVEKKGTSCTVFLDPPSLGTPCFSLLVVLFLTPIAQAEVKRELPKTLTLSLAEAENKAVETSLEIKRLGAQISSSEESLKAQKSSTLPRINLESNYRFQSEIPKAHIGPTEIQFGQHHNYSIGPVITYKLYDGGTDAKATESTSALIQAKFLEQKDLRLKTILETQQSYVNVQLGMEELQLVEATLKLVQARIKSIEERVQGGNASELELLSVQREESQLKLRYAQTQTSLTQSVHKLTKMIDTKDVPEPLIPGGISEKKRAKDIAKPNLIVKLEAMEVTLKSLLTHAAKAPNPNHPNLKALSQLIESARLAAESKENEAMPTVSLFAKSSYDYPNGPLDQHVWQNSLGVSISWNIYDARLKRDLSASKRAEVVANEIQKTKIDRDFLEIWRNLQSNLYHISEQKKIVAGSIATVIKEAKMITENYQAGSVTYIEVQRANNQVLEAQTTLLRLKAQEANFLASLNYLSAAAL